MASFVSSYIPTTDSAVTRAADVASITGTNFSSWYQQSGGSLFTHSARTSIVPTGEFPVAASLNDETSNNRINNSFITTPLAGLVVSSGGANVASIYPAVTALDRKFATAFATDDFAASVNGGAVLTDTSGALPVVNRLRIGDMTGGNALNGTIRRLVYWSQRLPNETLQGITQE